MPAWFQNFKHHVMFVSLNEVQHSLTQGKRSRVPEVSYNVKKKKQEQELILLI